jgi:hypothetical protein
MKTIDRLKSFLDKQSQLIKKIYPHPEWKYNGFEELVLDCGKEMSFAPLPKNIEPGLPKNCYYNCLEIVEEDSHFIYCEGYALPEDGILPVPHAWLINFDGRVIDPTWEAGGAYIGLPFDTEWLLSLLESRNGEDFVSVFECNYLEDFSLLRKGLPDDAIARTILIAQD